MKKILGISLILIGIFSGGMGIAVMGGGLAIIVGGGLIFYAFSNKEDSEDIPNDLKSRIRAKINKKKPKKKRSVLRFFIYAIGIPGVLIGILILMGS
jgi:hypothetical protein